MNLFPPSVNAINSSVQIGDSILFRSMFTASDLDGNSIVSYRFRDNSNAATSGFFTVRGVRQPSNAFIEVSASELNTVQYHAGLLAGNESFSVQVSDGQRLSTVDAAIASTILANSFAPVVIGRPQTVLEDELIPASSLFNVTDRDNSEIVRYFFVDRKTNSNGGHFVFKGVRQPSGRFFVVNANELGDLF
ncbi:MAG: hypothetical protein AAGA30_18905, partial [Planctomycetota bacterium]